MLPTRGDRIWAGSRDFDEVGCSEANWGNCVTTKHTRTSTDLFIVDNSDPQWTVQRYLHDWCELSRGIDVATGNFEIGSLLALDGAWQKVDQIRILMGTDTTKRTKRAFEEALTSALATLNGSIESEKQQNDFLQGVPAIVAAMRSGQLNCRMYRKGKFHAKAYITHARQPVIGAFALVGSSNFSAPGLTKNVELNVRLSGTDAEALQEWYERHWDDADDVTPEVLRVIERHVRDYTPFEVYAKALHDYFHADRLEPDDWERHRSLMYPVLDGYQRDGYHNMVEIAERYNGAFLCDAVGLGKTFIGLMLIERLILQERKNVLLLVPKAGLDTVWRPALKKYLPKIRRGAYGGFDILTHSDLSSNNEEIQDRLQAAAERAHAVIIDEAHHFRNTGTRGGFVGDVLEGATRSGRPIPGEGRVSVSRYWRLFDLIGDKRCFLMTATPINNRLADLRHMIELFSRRREDHFARAPLGVSNLQAHFRELDRRLEEIAQQRGQGSAEVTDASQAQDVLDRDPLINAIVVQRSRAFVKESQLLAGASITQFPVREHPKVIPYGLRSVYGGLLQMVDRAFHRNKPLFSLAPYFPLAYANFDTETDEYAFTKGRQKQVVALIRTGFLKRFESSVHSFDRSCERLVVKLLAFAFKQRETSSEKRAIEKWMARHEPLVSQLREHHPALFNAAAKEDSLFVGVEEDDGDPDLAGDVLDDIEKLSRDDFRVHEMFEETMQDLELLADFLRELDRFKPEHDDKCRQLIKLLRTDPILKKHKVLIFTEFADTAEYLFEQLQAAGITGLEVVDGSSAARQRADVIRRFAPYYNGWDAATAAAHGGEIRVLLSTDVLSEGLNLQDCCRLINYDLHWNPVRLMQRIGRVDRRMNPATEAAIMAAHPEQADCRGTVVYHNFLPPEELNTLLSLYSRVTNKTLRISKTFGIEGGKLLTADDEYDALREFNAAYERKRPSEDLRLEYERLITAHPLLAERLAGFPARVFSGKALDSSGRGAPEPSGSPSGRAVFFCFALPVQADAQASERRDEPTLFGRPTAEPDVNGAAGWVADGSAVEWYCYDLATKAILTDPVAIARLIRCEPETPRHCVMPQPSLTEIRALIEKHIKDTYLKRVQAPVGVKPVLRCWMELN